MCTYTAEDGHATDWHLVHLGSRAMGGAGMVMVEATAVLPEGRITPNDVGIWKDSHAEILAWITGFIEDHGSVPAIQLAHAGRKAGSRRPWDGGGQMPLDEGGWETYGPSAIPFSERTRTPKEMTKEDIARLVQAFADGAKRSLYAGFKVVEIHAAHGYLLHSFVSPISNQRTDEYGGSFENRTRVVREIAIAIRKVWPDDLPLFLRISATDWVEGGWDLEQTVRLALDLKELGVDLIDCSSGGSTSDAKIPVAPGYQVPFARAVKEAGVASAAVGCITEAEQAEAIVRDGHADMVLIGRASLADPHWPLRIAKELGAEIEWPAQYAWSRK